MTETTANAIVAMFRWTGWALICYGINQFWPAGTWIFIGMLVIAFSGALLREFKRQEAGMIDDDDEGSN